MSDEGPTRTFLFGGTVDGYKEQPPCFFPEAALTPQQIQRIRDAGQHPRQPTPPLSVHPTFPGRLAGRFPRRPRA